jgi:hypothetical protein
MFAPIYWCCWCYDVRSTNTLVLFVLAAPTGKDTPTFRKFKNFADFLNVSSTNILVLTSLQHQYRNEVQGESNVSSSMPTRLNVAYSISWSRRKWKYKYSKMAAKLKNKRTSITTMGAKIQAFDIFPTPLISHWSLPFSSF